MCLLSTRSLDHSDSSSTTAVYQLAPRTHGAQLLTQPNDTIPPGSHHPRRFSWNPSSASTWPLVPTNFLSGALTERCSTPCFTIPGYRGSRVFQVSTSSSEPPPPFTPDPKAPSPTSDPGVSETPELLQCQAHASLFSNPSSDRNLPPRWSSQRGQVDPTKLNTASPNLDESPK
jgi:hypothetical protein